MTAVMYHYVRPDAGTLSSYPYLSLVDFERQLDHFSDVLGLVGREAFERWVSGGVAPTGFLLTFDDGLRDHVDFVLPVLCERGLFGLFYVPSAPITNGVVLDVHKVHLALGRLGGPAALDRLKERYPELLEAAAEADAGHYATQTSSLQTKRVKRLLNWVLEPSTRREIVDDLVAFAFDGQAPAASEIYVGETGIRQLVSEGMGVGAHGHQHLVLDGLGAKQQEQEIAESCRVTQMLVGSLEWGYCYAYGSFDSTSERLVAATGCPFAFAVTDDDIETPLAETSRFALPRRNCNTFPHGTASVNECPRS